MTKMENNLNKQAVNLKSLTLIKQELMVTIDEASTHLETFINEKDNLNVLEDCILSLQQIRGSLDLVQLYGACELAGEILAMANDIKTSGSRHIDDKLAVLTKGFFVLSCYFEYIQQNETGMPVLLVPYINDIRMVNRQAPLAECAFENTQQSYRCPASEFTPLTEAQIASLRRYRHMYQVGLLGVIKEVNTLQSLQIMLRAINKVHKFSKGSASETFWWLCTYAIKAFIDAEMAVDITRKRLFSRLDKTLRALVTQGEAGFSYDADDEALKELAYFASISGVDQPEYKNIKVRYGFKDLNYTDEVLQQHTLNLTGPNANTVQSVAEILSLEINYCKEHMEEAQSTDSESVGSLYGETLARLDKVKEILDVVGLVSAAEVLVAPINNLKNAKTKGFVLDDEAVIQMADAFIYIESVLSSLEKRNFSNEKLAEINRLTQTEIMSSSHLEDAQLTVISEIEDGIKDIKSALTEFTDSNYDKQYIEALPAMLNEIRGGVLVLGLPRASTILEKCTDFIQHTLMSNNEVAALEQLMDTFADALICLEYYIDCLKVDKHASDDTLKVAEESLGALGFPV
jgi:hypothetical protein